MEQLEYLDREAQADIMLCWFNKRELQNLHWVYRRELIKKYQEFVKVLS